MRFQVMWKKTHLPPEAYRPFFETDSIDEAKDFAMRLAFDETNHVYVQDTRRDEIVRDFDAPVYRDCPPLSVRLPRSLRENGAFHLCLSLV